MGKDIDTIIIGSGSKIVFAIEGTNYRQKELRQIFADNQKTQLFSVTPPCSYQIQNEWPETPFVNINILGSTSTTKSNWLGYIDGTSATDNKDQIQVVKKIGEILQHRPVAVYGKVIKDTRKTADSGYRYKLLLFISNTSLDSALANAELMPKTTIKSQPKGKAGKQGHSLLLHILLCYVLVGFFTIPYYSISKKHYWHI